jgi:hypothetical protein
MMAEDIIKQQWDKKGKREVERNLTSQHLAGRLNNAKDKRIAFLMMHNFTVRLDTLSSRIDICFVKPQALLALSIAICAWRLAKVKRASRSEILEEYSPHWQHRRGGDKILEPNAWAKEGAWPRLKGSLMCID